MKKTLAAKLAIGAIAGATLLGAPKAKADPTIAYENTITKVNADGLGTFGDDANDYYTVGLWVHNISDYSQDTCTNLVYSTNLKDRGAYNFRDQYSVWEFDTNGQGDEWDFKGNNLAPSSQNNIYYDVKAQDFLGWETNSATMWAESGTATLGDVTIPIPESKTLGLIAGTGLAMMGVRKFFRI